MTEFTNQQLIDQAREEVDFWRERDELIPSQQTAIRLRLAEITLAALRAEPVAIVEPSDYVTAAQLVGECPARKAVHELYEGALRIGDKLYRHATPAPVVPDGYALVPVEPTEDMVIAGFEAELREEFRDPDAWEAYEAMSGCEQAAQCAKWCWAAMVKAAPDFREIPDSSTNNCRENAETSTNCPHCGRKPLKNRTCTVAGCEGRHVAHGLCQKHYDIDHKNNFSRRQNIRAANKRYRARKSAAPHQEADNG
ncbi:hypothetical protein LEADMM271B_14620 [Leclercia adecarboxylata]|uniref:hypothetical protein n=1 Tax=Leclercia adecarboxylata TaxID=83655 RepID=UPI003B22914F